MTTNRLGVDLGTTNTVAALADRLVALKGQRSMPSVVAFLPTGDPETGEPARRRRAIDAKNTIYSSKRVIGRSWNDPATEEFRERYPFEMVERDGGPAFVTRAGTYTPTQIAAILLEPIAGCLGGMADAVDAVITVPAGFGASQRDATLEAAAAAGFRRATLIDEPSAAARAYVASKGPMDTVAVYDLGGGTFDFSILDCSGREPAVLARGSDLFLGGDDVDDCIGRFVAQEVLRLHNWDLANYPEVYDRLLAECERAKVRLTRRDETVVDLAQVDPNGPAAGEGLTLRRDVMDRLADDLVRRTFVTCDRVLREGDLSTADLDAVLLAGGSTHLGMVKRGVAAYFGKPPRDDLEPTEVVALGACARLR